MPVIRIDDEVWEALRSRATPFEDTPNRVLRRLLGLAERRAKSSAAEVQVPLPALRWEIVQVLRWHFRGRAPVARLLATLNGVMALALPKAALERDESGEPRWWRQVRAELAAMQAEGLVEAAGSPDVLALTEAGEAVMPDGTCAPGPSRVRGRSPDPAAPRGSRPSPARD